MLLCLLEIFQVLLYLWDCLALGDVLIPHFHSGVAKAFQQVSGVQPHEESDFVCH